MKQSRPPLFTRRALVTLVCAAVCSFASATLLAVFRPEAPTKVFHRALTFQERVNYQRAIEEVYWRHRIWPKECPDPKPSLDTVMPRAQLEKKVEDYLHRSQALDHYWQRPTTAEQLQAEMNRMAIHTKQPAVLRELFEALGNDPFVVAECLAGPALSERLLTNLYAHDQRFHGQLRQHAEADLQAHNSLKQMKRTAGKYYEIELARSDGAQDEDDRGAETSVRMNSRDWEENLRKLAVMFGDSKNGQAQPQPVGCKGGKSTARIQTGVLSSLQEDEGRYYVTAVVEKSEGRLKLATVEWPKEPLPSWRDIVENQIPTVIPTTNANYQLPTILDCAKAFTGKDGCTDNTWMAMSGAPSGRYYHTAVWTGSEMIVWGGYADGTYLNTVGRYNPSTDTWTATSLTNAPGTRYRHTAVWTGSEMIIWGGIEVAVPGGYTSTGGRYDPARDSWTATSMTNAPSSRVSHRAIWTGSEMIVWGGYGNNLIYPDAGGRYNPASDSWTATSITNAPIGREEFTAVWTGNEMIVWGGVNARTGGTFNTGGKYNPSTDSWTAPSTANAPSSRGFHAGVWTGGEMIVWGGYSSGVYFSTGGRYNPATNTWIAIPGANAPSARAYPTAVWTGSEMIVWGGSNSSGGLITGGRYNPATGSWTATNSTTAPTSRAACTAVWTGNEMIIWGGYSNGASVSTGGRYDPGTDSWTSTRNVPSGRNYHTAVWTGSEMIVWGGYDGNSYLNTGGRYTPSTDNWTATSAINAPSGRHSHIAVWTGNEMIVWGGFDGNCSVNSGGRYDPGTDRWTSTRTVNAPAGRAFATAVWTGSEMIVWGGEDCSANVFGDGGRYNPGTDTWATTTGINAPTARFRHTAAWTGNEMIIWGGTPDGSNYLNTGGRYLPSADSWATIGMTNAPTARYFHTAVWTGSEMIIWGGELSSNTVLNTGGKYDPGTDSWTTTSMTNAPSVRGDHTAVWTGSEMIVWGGFDHNVFYLSTGGRYNPAMNSWTSTSTTNNAPIGRWGHTAVWTGSEMIVWGGINSSFYLNNGGRYCGGSTPRLEIRSIVRLANGHVLLQCIGLPNHVNDIQASPDLSPGSFVTMVPPPAAADATGAFSYEDTNASSLTKRFYRIASP